MALLPARTKYRKAHKGRIYHNAKRGTTLAFGDFGMQTLERAPLTGAEIEAARVAINRYLKRRGKVYIRIFPHKPVTKKPAETRMGRGKGAVEFYVAVVRPGNVLFEIAGVSISAAREAFRLADAKLSVRSRLIMREDLAVA